MTEIYEHPPSGQTLLPALHAFLPHSLPLTARLSHPTPTPHSHILATFPPSSPPPQCWAAAYLDRSHRPETESWIFVSGSAPGRCAGFAAAETVHEKAEGEKEKPRDVCPACAEALMELVAYMTGLPLPPVEARPARTGRYFPPEGREPLLIGSLAEGPARVLDGRGWVARDLPGLEEGYWKYIFQPQEGEGEAALPAGLRMESPVRRQDLKTVLERTEVPRGEGTMAGLESVGVYEGEQLVGWGFVGLDGSVTSLGVEEEWRRRGIAKAIVRWVVGRAAGLGGGYAHADVGMGNGGSNAVCVKAGGRRGGVVYWVRIEIPSPYE
ncbi:hypothetical protein EJ06DRAFT_471123 [Trichodelitschia bisporula]|uniref:N-acetyltransferase domain-containing protein n=1 Tax=Trichodelitschia bisporula TaxID=703511 RepID=A0A6G1I777_9PEZI|nr:hypothetical protein EJ06DRAFT_471123 [Trichodelitschia bisporula]